MPLNISALLAHSKNRWGVLFYVPYRETGFGAINRTIFTSALYLAVIGGDFTPHTKSPMLVYKEENNYPIDFAATEDGFCIAYITRDTTLVSLYPIRQSERPLTLPVAMHQYKLGFERWHNDINMYVAESGYLRDKFDKEAPIKKEISSQVSQTCRMMLN